MSQTWFTADTHFGHVNIISYSARPFVKLDGQPDVVAMDEALVRNWNEMVQPDDVVWHLGDFALRPNRLVSGYAKRLNGVKHLVLGNHDRCSKTVYREMGFEVHKGDTLCVGDVRIRMVHDPARLDLANHDLGLCGHVHEAWKEVSREGKRVINVGVDVRDFRPVALAELLAGGRNLDKRPLEGDYAIVRANVE